MPAKTQDLTDAVTTLTTTVTTVATALDDLAAKVAAIPSGDDPAAQAAIDTAVANIKALSGNLTASVTKDDPTLGQPAA